MINKDKRYDEKYYEGNDQGGDRLALSFYANVFEKELTSAFGPGKKILLDFGCGVGHLVKRLAKNNDCFAFDISDYALDEVKKKSPKTIIVNDTKKITKKLDGIIALHVLEHIDKPTNTFKEFYDILKPKGLVFIVIPNPEGLGHKIKKDKWFAYNDKTHVSIFNQGKWVTLLSESGFDIKKVKTDGLWDAPYYKNIPLVLQKLIFFPLPALQVLFGKLFIPVNWGECLIIIAQKK